MNTSCIGRVQRRTHVSGAGRTRPLRQLWHGISDTLSSGHRRQLEWHHERRAPRGLRRRSGLREELLRGRRYSTDVFRHIRVNGAIRTGQRSGRRAHEASRGVPQTGTKHRTKTLSAN